MSQQLSVNAQELLNRMQNGEKVVFEHYLAHNDHYQKHVAYYVRTRGGLGGFTEFVSYGDAHGYIPYGTTSVDREAFIELVEAGLIAYSGHRYHISGNGSFAVFVAVETISDSEAQTFTVTQDDNEIVIDGETFFVDIRNPSGVVSIEIDGGYGLAQYDDGSEGWIEVDGRYQVAWFDDIDTGDSYDSEFQVTITPEMIADAKRYRANYPADIESEF